LPYDAKERLRGKKSLSVEKGIKSVNGILLGRDFMRGEIKVKTTMTALCLMKNADSFQIDQNIL